MSFEEWNGQFAVQEGDLILVSGRRSYYRCFGNVVGQGTNAMPSTLAHELFHKIDASGKISMRLSEALMKDYAALNVDGSGDVKAYLLRLHPEAEVWAQL